MATKWIVKEKDDDIETVMSYYAKIRDALEGLKEIVDINFQEKNIYHQLASDNLKALDKNIVKILKHTNSSRELEMRLRECEVEENETEESLAL